MLGRFAPVALVHQNRRKDAAGFIVSLRNFSGKLLGLFIDATLQKEPRERTFRAGPLGLELDSLAVGLLSLFVPIKSL